MFEDIRNPRKEETASDKPRSINSHETEEQSAQEIAILDARRRAFQALRQARIEDEE